MLEAGPDPASQDSEHVMEGYYAMVQSVERADYGTVSVYLVVKDAMIADENPQAGNACPATLGGTPVMLNVRVDDPDATVAKAVAEGGTIRIPVADQFYGYRSGRIQDPAGHLWIVSKLIEAISPEEMQRRMDMMMSAERSVGGGG